MPDGMLIPADKYPNCERCPPNLSTRPAKPGERCSNCKAVRLTLYEVSDAGGGFTIHTFWMDCNRARCACHDCGARRASLTDNADNFDERPGRLEGMATERSLRRDAGVNAMCFITLAAVKFYENLVFSSAARVHLTPPAGLTKARVSS